MPAHKKKKEELLEHPVGVSLTGRKSPLQSRVAKNEWKRLQAVAAKAHLPPSTWARLVILAAIEAAEG